MAECHRVSQGANSTPSSGKALATVVMKLVTAVENVKEMLPLWWQEKLLLDFLLTAPTEGTGISLACLLSHFLL